VSELHRSKLIEFAKKSLVDSGGFGWLTATGNVDEKKNLAAWINFRMTYVFGLEKISGNDSATKYLQHGINAMRNLFHDEVNGGFYAEVSNIKTIDGQKKAYEFAFALLALSTATRAGIVGAKEDLAAALVIFEKYFWDETFGLVNESWDQTFRLCSDYHGLNANMHTVEAFLELYKSSEDTKWLNRALRICKFAFEEARTSGVGLIPEHFDNKWVLDKEFNNENPGDPFHPYGIIIGHQFEWARLAIELSMALGATAPKWLETEAMNVYKIAKRIGWNVDGAPGFIYTVDFSGKSVVQMRMHWVITEAVAAAWVLSKIDGSKDFVADFDEWRNYAEKYFLDQSNGSWRHELNALNEESATVWDGRPDIYHAYQTLAIIY
jgi:mannose/cellobiose epimerase-like protein (N-acyl-D-glucosamine 2-epimerase family)